MSLLVEYTLQDGQSDAQVAALNELVAGLKQEGTEGFSYTGYATDDPTRFVAVFEFDDDTAKQRFQNSRSFAAYRDGSKNRFVAPPKTTTIRRVASTLD